MLRVELRLWRAEAVRKGKKGQDGVILMAAGRHFLLPVSGVEETAVLLCPSEIKHTREKIDATHGGLEQFVQKLGYTRNKREGELG